MSSDGLYLSLTLRRGGFRLSLTEMLTLSGVPAVLGRSGSGKTSLLRAIAGLDPVEAGQIRFGDTVWDDQKKGVHVPAHRRGVGYVFQEARLFSHLTVQGNLDFAAKRARKAGETPDMDRAVRAAGLDGLLDRRPETLSGGESRRVALARALVSCPRLLLLDEPLNGLDRAARRTILPFLRALPNEAGCPILYVSHDIEEVGVLADQVLVLDKGRAVANGPILDVAQSLDLGPLREADAPAALVEARVADPPGQAGLGRLDLGGEALLVPVPEGVSAGERVRLFIDARDVSIALERPAGISIRNILGTRIVSISNGEAGRDADIELAIGESRFWSRITRAACEELGLEAGQTVFALIKSVRLAGDG